MRTAVVYNFLLEANLMASIAILLMLPIRRFLRGRLGSRAIYFAWLLVAVRLLCPLTLPNPAINGIRSPFAMDSAIRPIAGQLMVRFQDILSRVEQLMEEHPALPGSAAVAKDMNHLLEGMYNGMLPLTLMKIYLAGAALVVRSRQSPLPSAASGWADRAHFRAAAGTVRASVPPAERAPHSRLFYRPSAQCLSGRRFPALHRPAPERTAPGSGAGADS